jgi:large subunit ribosomal protein L29
MKQSEIKDLSAAELQENLVKLKEKYADLKMAHAISPIENPLQIKKC